MLHRPSLKRKPQERENHEPPLVSGAMTRAQSTAISPPRAREGPPWAQLARIAVSVGLLAYLFVVIDVGAALAILGGAHGALLLAMVCVAVAERIFAAWRWYLLLRLSDHDIRFPRVLRLTLVSSFAGYAFPGSVGVEAVRIYGVTRTTADLGHAVSSVLVERMLAMLALMLLIAIGLAFSAMPWPALEWVLWVSFAALLSGVLLIMLPAGRRATLALLPGGRLAPIRNKLAEIYAALDVYRRRPGVVWLSLGAAVVFQLLRVVMAALGAWALGAETGLFVFLAIVPAVGLITTLPISIGGFGVQEVGFVYLFGMAGMAGETALALSLLLHLMVLVAIVPGAWLYWRRGLAL
jgi:glycosyltransferase 2 family protein